MEVQAHMYVCKPERPAIGLWCIGALKNCGNSVGDKNPTCACIKYASFPHQPKGFLKHPTQHVQQYLIFFHPIQGMLNYSLLSPLQGEERFVPCHAAVFARLQITKNGHGEREVLYVEGGEGVNRLYLKPEC